LNEVYTLSHDIVIDGVVMNEYSSIEYIVIDKNFNDNYDRQIENMLNGITKNDNYKTNSIVLGLIDTNDQDNDPEIDRLKYEYYYDNKVYQNDHNDHRNNYRNDYRNDRDYRDYRDYRNDRNDRNYRNYNDNLDEAEFDSDEEEDRYRNQRRNRRFNDDDDDDEYFED
jgi:hypothetical protein